jgi:hypothetical protein
MSLNIICAHGRAAMRAEADAPRWQRRVWLGSAQYGGVVMMGDGVVDFKGGTINSTKAMVRIAHDAWPSAVFCVISSWCRGQGSCRMRICLECCM